MGITQFIDKYLETHQMEYITPPEANELLAKAGLLTDNKSRAGKPLRDLLRKKKFPHAFKRGRLWYIPRSNNPVVHDNQNELLICDNKEHIISEKKKKNKLRTKKKEMNFMLYGYATRSLVLKLRNNINLTS